MIYSGKKDDVAICVYIYKTGGGFLYGWRDGGELVSRELQLGEFFYMDD